MILLKGVIGQRIFIKLVDATDNETPETGIAFTPQYSKNGLAFTNFTNARVEIGNGWYYVEPTDTEVNTDGGFIVRVSAAGCNVFDELHEVKGLVTTTDIKAQVDAALVSTTYSEPTGAYISNSSLGRAILEIRQVLINRTDSKKLTATTGEVAVYLSDGATVRYKKTYTDADGVTFTLNKPS